MAVITADVDLARAVHAPPGPVSTAVPIEVRPFEAADAAQWTAYLDRHSASTLFHGLEWKRAVERTFGHRFRGFTASRGDQLVGVLPLYEVRSLFAGKLLVSVPYATYGGILADDAAVVDRLYAAARTLQQSIGARSLEFRSIRAEVPDLAARVTHATFVRSLPETPEAIDAMLPRKARAAARRAVERGGLSVEFDPGRMEVLWQLYARSMRRLASPNYPLRFFREIAGALPDRHIVQIVRHNGVAVAGLFSFIWRDRVIPYFVGIDERVEVYGLSHYLYSESMKHAVAIGCRVYDFGRSRIDNRGPFEFKRLCGFEPTELQYQVAVADGRAAPDLSPTSPRWSAARRAWRTLPLAITRPLGGWLAKSIPG